MPQQGTSSPFDLASLYPSAPSGGSGGGSAFDLASLYDPPELTPETPEEKIARNPALSHEEKVRHLRLLREARQGPPERPGFWEDAATDYSDAVLGALKRPDKLAAGIITFPFDIMGKMVAPDTREEAAQMLNSESYRRNLLQLGGLPPQPLDSVQLSSPQDRVLAGVQAASMLLGPGAAALAFGASQPLESNRTASTPAQDIDAGQLRPGQYLGRAAGGAMLGAAMHVAGEAPAAVRRTVDFAPPDMMDAAEPQPPGDFVTAIRPGFSRQGLQGMASDRDLLSQYNAGLRRDAARTRAQEDDALRQSRSAVNAAGWQDQPSGASVLKPEDQTALTPRQTSRRFDAEGRVLEELGPAPAPAPPPAKPFDLATVYDARPEPSGLVLDEHPPEPSSIATDVGTTVGGHERLRGYQKRWPVGSPLQAFETPEVWQARSDAAAVPPPPDRPWWRTRVANLLYGQGAKVKGKRFGLVIGNAGSGKSSVVVDKIRDQHGSLLIDADQAKMADQDRYGHGEGATALHPESMQIRDEILDRALANKDNIVWSTTGYPLSDGARSNVSFVKRLMNSGYDVHVHYVDLPEAKATQRMLDGYRAGERHFVEPEVIFNAGDRGRRAYAEVKQLDGIGSYTAWNNDVPRGTEPIRIEHWERPSEPPGEPPPLPEPPASEGPGPGGLRGGVPGGGEARAPGEAPAAEPGPAEPEVEPPPSEPPQNAWAPRQADGKTDYPLPDRGAIRVSQRPNGDWAVETPRGLDSTAQTEQAAHDRARSLQGETDNVKASRALADKVEGALGSHQGAIEAAAAEEQRQLDEAPVRNAEKVQPPGTAPNPGVAKIRQNLMRPEDPYITNGLVMINKGALGNVAAAAQKMLDNLSAKTTHNLADPADVGPNAKLVWDSLVPDMKAPGTPLGEIELDEPLKHSARSKGATHLALFEVNGQLVKFDAGYLALLKRITGYDRLLFRDPAEYTARQKAKEQRPLSPVGAVAYKGKKPVAVLMGFGPDAKPEIDLDAARARAQAGWKSAPKGPDEGGATVYANPIAPAIRGTARIGLGIARRLGETSLVRDVSTRFNRHMNPAALGSGSAETVRELRAGMGEQAARIERLKDSFYTPRPGVKGKILDAIFGKATIFDQMPDEQRLDFIHRMETDQRQATPELQQMANNLREVLDHTRDRVRALGTGALNTWIENYFPHFWKKPGEADEWLGTLGPRPLEGPKSFTRERTIPTVREGMFNADGSPTGRELITTDPVGLTLLKVREMERFILARQFFDAMKRTGLARLHPWNSGKVQKGFTYLDDNLFNAGSAGHYVVSEGAGRIIQNYLSPGLRGGPIEEVVQQATNRLNQAQLGLSAFHAGFTSFDAVISRVALGLTQQFRGAGMVGRGDVAAGLREVRNGLGDMGSALATPLSNPLHGARVRRAYVTGRGSAADLQVVDWIKRAGGRVSMDAHYKGSALANILDGYRRGGVGGYGRAAIEAPFGVLELAAKPIMEHLVPNQKIGVFADLARDAMEHMDPKATRAEQDMVLQRIWDSVDNRMGQLVYDNLFWDRATKQTLMMMTRSLGWNLGTLREVGGGTRDIVREGTKLLAGEKAELTPAAAYTMALAMTVGAMGAVTTYLVTGHGPRNWRDYIYPEDGTYDEDGNANRVMYPTYAHDWLAMFMHPYETIKHKEAPALQLAYQELENEDFFGDMIRNPEDPWWQRAQQGVAYAAHEAMPFSFTNQGEARLRGDQSFLGTRGNFLGVRPAPREAVRSDAQNLMAQYLESRRVVGATPEDVAARHARREILSNLRGMDADQLGDNIDRAVQMGYLTGPQYDALLRRAGTTPIEEQYKRLTYPQALKVYQRARPWEQQLFLPILNTKMENAARMGALP